MSADVMCIEFTLVFSCILLGSQSTIIIITYLLNLPDPVFTHQEFSYIVLEAMGPDEGENKEYCF